MNQYKTRTLIEEMKLPPISGTTKAGIDRYNSGEHFYMELNEVTALIKIIRDYFPNAI